MDFFDKIGKKASETYKVTAEKTGKLAKEAKLRMKMNEAKSDINDLYKQIGKKVYEKHTLGEGINIKAELEEEITKIDVLSNEIECTLEEILSLKDRRKCENCYEEIEKASKFCPNCGAKQEPIDEPEPENNYQGEDSIEKAAEILDDKPEDELAKEVEIVDNKPEDD